MPNREVHKSRIRQWIVVVAIALCSPGLARGQALRVSSTAGGSFGGITSSASRIGQGVTGYFRNDLSFSAANRAPAYVNSDASYSFGGSGQRGDLIGRGVSNNFAQSSFGRTIPVRDTGVAHRVRLNVPQRSGDLYFQPGGTDILAQKKSFTAPVVWSEVPLVRMRDGLSVGSPTGQARYGPSFKHRTMSDVLKSRRDNSKEAAIADAWEWFAKREFSRAFAGFRNAEIVDATDPETRVGQFFCALAEGKYALVNHIMNRIVERDMDQDIFGRSFGIPQRFDAMADHEDSASPPKVSLEGRINEFTTVARAGDISAATLASLSFAFWHSESDTLRLEAVQTADLLQKNDVSGQYQEVHEQLLQASSQRSGGGG